MSLEINKVIEGIEKNIRAVLLNKDFTLDDAKMNIIDVLGVLKDMWIRFQDVFTRVNELIEIEKNDIENNTKTEENDDLKNLYL